MVDIYTVSVVAFFALLAVLLYRDRKHVEVKAYIFFLRKTKRGIQFLDRFAQYTVFWKIVGTIGIFVAFYLMISGMYVLVDYGQLILAGKVKTPGLNLVLPSPTSQQISGPGFIGIPFWSWIIIIASVIIPHEFMHGILARVEKIRVKSVGLALFAIFPGAFVEPDEKQLKKINLTGKLRIFAVGGFANFILATIIFSPGFNLGILNIPINHGILSDVIWPSFAPGSVVITEVNSTGPAGLAGLQKGTIVNKINDVQLKVSYSDYLSKGYLSTFFENIKPGEEVTLQTETQSFNVKTGINPTNSSRPYLGISFEPYLTTDSRFFYNTVGLLTWMWILNYTIAIVNLAPIYPLDGGLMIKAGVEKISKKYATKVTVIITLIAIGIFLVNIFGPFLVNFFVPTT